MKSHEIFVKVSWEFQKLMRIYIFLQGHVPERISQEYMKQTRTAATNEVLTIAQNFWRQHNDENVDERYKIVIIITTVKSFAKEHQLGGPRLAMFL